MANMSYCRYENTREDLQDCFQDALDHRYNDAEDAVSEDEIYEFKGMIKDIIEFLEETGILYGEFNSRNLEKLCEKMRLPVEEEEEE